MTSAVTMRRRSRRASTCAFALALGAWSWATSTPAHHGTSQYRMSEEFALTGTVVSWTFENPHSWLRLDVEGPAGETTEWSIESAPPDYMARQGWSAASLAEGQKVTVLVSPLRAREPPNRAIVLEIDPAEGEALVVRPRGRFGRPARPE